MPALLQALKADFAAPHQMPQRQLLPLGHLSSADGTQPNHDAIALLPAWNDHFISCKLFSYFPANPAQGLPLLHARLMLLARQSGVPLALFEARSLTNFRTAAVSALAASYLAKPTASRLLLLGTGQLLAYFVRAYLAVRPLREIAIAGRSLAKTQAAVAQLTSDLPALLAQDGYCGALPQLAAVTLDQAQVGNAEIISCISAAEQPLFPASWVQAGTLVDAVGNHRADVSEIDPDLVVNGRLFVDNRVNCLAEAGEILLPWQAGCFGDPQDKQNAAARIVADLAQLCQADQLRWQADQIQVFKSVGTALADLSAAALVWQHLAKAAN
jgi:1-pyrroline-2-carboxylate reductase [NAD(P)H]